MPIAPFESFFQSSFYLCCMNVHLMGLELRLQCLCLQLGQSAQIMMEDDMLILIQE